MGVLTGDPVTVGPTKGLTEVTGVLLSGPTSDLLLGELNRQGLDLTTEPRVLSVTVTEESTLGLLKGLDLTTEVVVLTLETSGLVRQSGDLLVCSLESGLVLDLDGAGVLDDDDSGEDGP